ncbi:cytochrome c oxidase assembly protein [Bacillus horti]|uniref:Membrane protein n=1 Tax=Caldalkalibacillus horti TaxID=77523 RepID=A0ABT9W0J3_9BACI|nr:cytochrome c oxidase assembly protein [Bacillus horti]MDQ0166783.1 putative membrane protein [Bacillus horti]
MSHLSHGHTIVSFETIVLLFIFALIMYTVATMKSNQYKHLRKWPIHRYICWFLGVLCAAISVVGPLAELAHINFTAHMIGHLFLGMLAPLLIALSAPLTLLLRTVNIPTARRLARILKSWPMRVPTHPVVATIFNIGGLWVLYTTELYMAMQQNLLLHFLIHLHVFLAGYFFTVSMIYIDQSPHRFSFIYRSVVLVLALAGHGILSKYIYANPPSGVSAGQAEIGGMLMYYGGDAIDVVLIFILCFQWYKSTRPRVSVSLVTN